MINYCIPNRLTFRVFYAFCYLNNKKIQGFCIERRLSYMSSEPNSGLVSSRQTTSNGVR